MKSNEQIVLLNIPHSGLLHLALRFSRNALNFTLAFHFFTFVLCFAFIRIYSDSLVADDDRKKQS